MSKAPVVETARSLENSSPTIDRPVRVVVGTHLSATLISPHRHGDCDQLLVPTHGIVRVISDDFLSIVPPAKGVFIPSTLEHSIIAPGNATLMAVSIHPNSLSGLGKQCRVVNMTRLVVALIDAIAQLADRYPPDSPDARLVSVFLDQLQAAPGEPFQIALPRDPRARSIADSLLAAPGSQLTLRDWGRKFGASQRTLARIFEAETGMGFRDYRRQVRMHASLGLLASGSTINNAAFELGYESTSAFIHAFRKVVGTTPGRFQA